MKTSKKRLSILLSVLLVVLTVSCLAVCFTASAAGGTDGGIEWDYNNSTKTLTISAAGSGANSGVMNDYDDIYIYQLPPWSEAADSVKTIIINSGVKYIGTCAFALCENMQSVTVPASVTHIGEDAFYFETHYRRVDITDLVAWNEIDFDSLTSNPLCTADGLAELFLNGTEVTDLTLLSGVTSIGAYAFAGCRGMKRITIPTGVARIGEGAFCFCEYLENVKIPNSMTEIGDGAFYGCSSLTYVTIPTGVLRIGASAFYYCKYLENVTIPNSVTEIGNGAFAGCESLTNVTIPDGVTSIGQYTFYNCTSLTSVTIPDGVTSIGESTFSYCEYLESVTIPNSVTEIGDEAFCRCTSLTSVTIPDGVKSIGKQAFSGCKYLSCVTIGTNMKSIGSKAFADCIRLQAINYRGSEAQWNAITKDEGAFEKCPADMTVNFNYNGVSSGADGGVNWTYNANTKALTISGTGAMPDYLGNFAGPEVGPMSPWRAYFGEVKTVTVSGVTSIGQYAFSGFGALEDVTISQGVTSIGGSAFLFCNALQTVSIPASMASIGEWVFLQNERNQIIINYAGSAAQWNAIQFGENVFSSLNSMFEEDIPHKVAVLLPGFVNLPFGSDGLKDKDWYFDFSAYVAYMVEEYNLTESYPGEAEEFFEKGMANTTLQFNPATETIMYTYVNDGKPEVFVMTQEDEYNTRPFIKQYTAPVPTYTVTANAEAGGSATGGGTFNKGATATVKATPNSGYHFTGWYKGNSKVSGDASYSFTVTENVTLTAKFEKDASSGDNGGNNGGSNQNANRCHWCGKTHDANFFQKIIGFFHNILAKIFGNKY